MEVSFTEISDYVHVTGEIFVQVQGKRENTAVWQRWMATDLGAEVRCLVAALGRCSHNTSCFRCRTVAATHHRPSWNAITTDFLLATNFKNLFGFLWLLWWYYRFAATFWYLFADWLNWLFPLSKNEGRNCIIHNEISLNNRRQCQFIVSSDFLRAR